MPHCASLAPRAPLPTSQITPECSSRFTQAYSLCSDAASRTPGSLCCTALQQPGTDCLRAIQAALSAPNGDGDAASQL